MTRVVLDTNILLSACLKPDRLEAQVVQLALDRAITACVSAPVLAEYQEVLLRDKFLAMRDRALLLLPRIEQAALLVNPTVSVAACVDPDDNRFLECAAAARAAYLVTGNLRDFPPVWGVAQILNARQFLAAIGVPPLH
jgi:putative PIN family toxin of toxin-antitoxin system